MIDTKLIKQAPENPIEIQVIDKSWRDYVDSIKENIFRIPFKGNYNALIKDDYIFIEGYCGLLLIDKVYYSHKSYLLKNQVKHYPFRIYGMYDKRGWFEGFVAQPEIGFHYMGMTAEQGHTICTGDIEYPKIDSIDALKEVSLKIIHSFRLINMESLGAVFLPDDYPKLKSIFSNKDEDSRVKFEKLLNEGLIEEIL